MGQFDSACTQPYLDGDFTPPPIPNPPPGGPGEPRAAAWPWVLRLGRLSRMECVLDSGLPRLVGDVGDVSPPPPPAAYFPLGVRGAIVARDPRVVISYPALTICELW
jgi:hypothetical protein